MGVKFFGHGQEVAGNTRPPLCAHISIFSFDVCGDYALHFPMLAINMLRMLFSSPAAGLLAAGADAIATISL